MNNSYGLAIHGGAGTITRSLLSPEKEKNYNEALLAALCAGEAVLKSGGSAMDAVIACVMSLEDCPLFNAGRGAVFTAEGTHEMDASLMNGNDLDAGAVAGVSGVRNPVLLAREIMLHSDHVLLAGKGAEQFAKERGLKFEDHQYFHDKYNSTILKRRIKNSEL
jgi:L-asparaginase / beta-aspartyl-peptidase